MSIVNISSVSTAFWHEVGWTSSFSDLFLSCTYICECEYHIIPATVYFPFQSECVCASLFWVEGAHASCTRYPDTKDTQHPLTHTHTLIPNTPRDWTHNTPSGTHTLSGFSAVSSLSISCVVSWRRAEQRETKAEYSHKHKPRHSIHNVSCSLVRMQKITHMCFWPSPALLKMQRRISRHVWGFSVWLLQLLTVKHLMC